MSQQIHSIFSPSGFHRLVHCTGSLLASAGEPEGDTQSAMEGQAAHWAAEEMLYSFIKPDRSIITGSDIVGKKAPNDVEITDEMFQGAREYVNDILQTADQCGGLQKLHVEERVNIPRIHAECYGYPDCWLFDDKTGVLYVWDFKFGRRTVEIVNNWQFIAYVCGILDQLTGGNGLADQHINVVATVVQPRNWHILGTTRRWKFKGSDIRAEVNVLIDKCNEAISGDATFISGDHCYKCPVRYKCSAYQNAAYNACDLIDSMGEINEMPADQMAVEIRLLSKAKDRLDGRLEALQAEAEAKLLSGQTVKGLVMQNGRGSTVWTETNEFVIDLGNMYNVDLRKSGVKTPTQAKSLIDPEVIKAYSETKKGAAKLTLEENTFAHYVFTNKH